MTDTQPAQPLGLDPVRDHLAQRAINSTIDTTDVLAFVEAQLPGGLLQITPTAEQDGWAVILTWKPSYDSATVYRSYPGGADEAHGPRLLPLLAAIDAVLAEWDAA